MKKYSLISFALLISFQQLSAKERNTRPDTPEVKLFVPGSIPTTATNSLAPAFTPNGNSVYFGQSSADKVSAIVVSNKKDNKWSPAWVAPFSGSYRDLEPAFAPGGEYLIFASNRPANAGGALLEGHYNNDVLPGKGGNLWKVELTKKGWGVPQVLPGTVNQNTSVFSPAITGDGSLYFMRADNGGLFHIYRSQLKNGKYEAPVAESYTDKDHGDYDPAVAPDESFIIFSSGRAPAPKVTDLFIAFRTPRGRWGDLIDLRTVLSDKVHGIEARLSPDCKTLYFSNSTNAAGINDPNARYIWQVDISDLLKAHGINKISTKKTAK